MVSFLEKERAQADARRANARLSAIRDAERMAENAGMAGKTFKFQNSYSCPEKPNDYWYLYGKVRKVDSAGVLSVFFFETDKYSKQSVWLDPYRYSMSDYTPIKASEFNKAWRAFQKRIAGMKP